MDDPTTSGAEGFGLLFYVSRFYDPGLGRFAQADTIVQGGGRKANSTVSGVAETQYVPLTVQYSGKLVILNKLNVDNAFLLSKGGLQNLSREDKRKAKIADVPLETQVLDRFSYSLNNPIRYNDPTGYDTSDGDSWFGWHEDDNGILTMYYMGEVYRFEIDTLTPAMIEKVHAFKAAVAAFGDLDEDLADDFVALGLGGIGIVVSAVLFVPACTAGGVVSMGSTCVGELALIGLSVASFGYGGFKMGYHLAKAFHEFKKGGDALQDLLILISRKKARR